MIKDVKLIFASFLLLMYRINKIIKLQVCPVAVARAAPFIPQFNLKIKIGSKMMFTIAPILKPIIDDFGLPCDLSKIFNT